MTISDLISAIPDFVIYVGFLLALYYIYYTWNYDYWKNMNVKTYLPFPSFVTSFQFLFKTMHEVDTNCYRKFGKIWGAFEGRTPVLFVADLDAIRSIMIKDFVPHFVNRRKILLAGKNRVTRYFLNIAEGEEWKAHRAVLTPTFTTGKLKQMPSLMTECAKELVEGINEKLQTEKDDMDLKQNIRGYAMNIISNCCFGHRINSKDTNDPFLVHANKIFNPKLNLKVFISLLFPKLTEYLDISIIPKDVLHFFERVVNQVMTVRKEQKDKPRDFLQLILEAQMNENLGKRLTNDNKADEQDHYDLGSNLKSIINENISKKKVLTEEAVVGHCLFFLLGGFDTTATAISFAIYLLAVNPDCQEKLAAEIQTTLQTYSNLSYEAISSMEYLDKVVSETLRIMPIAVRLERRCTKDYRLGEILIKKDMIVHIPVYSIHHDEKYYPNPEKFDPERFSPEVKSQRDPFCYLPFGAGPRNCIGMRFALLETKIALTHLFKEFRISPSHLTDIPMKFKPANSLLVPANGVHLKIEKRN